jgi:sulfatase maturation enzyme AslB (radical SAM superfamily)
MANIYSGLKVFHFKEKIDSLDRELSEILPPIHVRLKPTNICNHNCRYCAYRNDSLQLGKNMKRTGVISKEKIMEITEDVIAMGVKAITFSGGGEPLVYPHLADVLLRLIDSPVKFAALTNGAELSGEIARLFAIYGTWIRVSMDGWDNASYVRYRRTSDGEYSKIIRNMDAFKQIGGKCRLGVSLIVDQHNADHVYESILRIKDVGADSVKVSPCIVSNKGGDNNAYHKPIFKQVKAQIERAVQALKTTDLEIFDAYHELKEKFDKNYQWCPYCQILPVIGADLNIYSCQDKAYNLDSGLMGNISQIGFKNFWFADKSRFFLINPSKECNHHCVANSKNHMILDYLRADRDHLGFV